MKRILAIFLLLLFFAFGMAVNLRAEEDSTTEPSETELLLLELINEARRAPLDMAVSLGMDTEQILRDFPEMNDILTQGMEPLVFNPQLYAAAKSHNKDMLANNYYSHTSPDGRNYKDRILESGYRAVISGESLGLVGFVNYMSADDAVRIIFENMFRDELNPIRTEKRNILDPDLRDAGMSFASGSMILGNNFRNVYVAVCAYARHEIDPETVRSEIGAKINNCRENPEQIVALSDLSDQDGFSREMLGNNQLPILSLNCLLMDAASNHSRDMAENLFFDNMSSDGKSPWDRSVSVGYNAVYLSEMIGLIVSDKFLEPEQIADMFIQKTIEKEILSSYPIDSYHYILNEDVKDMGIGVDILYVDSGAGQILGFYFLVLDFATETRVFGGGCAVDYDKFIIGNTYAD